MLKPRAAVSEGPRRRPRRPMTWAQGGGGDGGRPGTPLGGARTRRHERRPPRQRAKERMRRQTDEHRGGMHSTVE